MAAVIARAGRRGSCKAAILVSAFKLKGRSAFTHSNAFAEVDWGGNSGTGEYAVMALDYYTWTGDSSYLPLAFAAADFFMYHFPNRSSTGKVIVWPAQVRNRHYLVHSCLHRVRSLTYAFTGS